MNYVLFNLDMGHEVELVQLKLAVELGYRADGGRGEFTRRLTAALEGA